MAVGNIRGTEPRFRSTAHGREDTTHPCDYHTDSDGKTEESQVGGTGREEKVQKKESAGRTVVC